MSYKRQKMADSNSEPPRCPCGFYGSAQTSGLCSKCYKDHLQKAEQAAGGGTSATQTPGPNLSDQLSRAMSQVSPLAPLASTSQGLPASSAIPGGNTSSPLKAATSGKDTAATSNKDNSNSGRDGSSGERPNQEGAEGGTNNNKTSEDTSKVFEDADKPKQKNKKRCYKCNCKLELAIREIGRCKCEYVFCQLHRLPEQHDCVYDHKEKGRQAAREKMISPKKHMGTSLKRIDSDGH